MSFTVIIPARFASSRLPGKPLADIAGKPMIQHVFEKAQQSGASRVIIATDNEQVEKAAKAFGAEVCMTSEAHNSGTERLAEVVSKLGIADDEIIVKMQSPLIVRRHDSVTNKDIYYTYADEGFSKALCENVEIFIQKMEIGVDTEGLSIEPVKARKVVVNCFGRKVDANLGIYKISGNCELLNILYQAGLGARRSEGHGKFEILL